MLAIEAVRHGVQDYLVKGQADERQIAHAIRYAIERQRMEKELRRSEERIGGWPTSLSAWLRKGPRIFGARCSRLSSGRSVAVAGGRADPGGGA